MTPIYINRQADEFTMRNWLEQAITATDRDSATTRDLARLYATSVMAYRAANKRADNVALVPLVIKDSAGELLAKTHPMVQALERKYRDNMRRSELTLCFYGRNLLWKRRSYNDTVYALRWLNPRLWLPDTGFRSGLKGFRIYRDGAGDEPVAIRYINRADAIYMHAVDFEDDFDGVAPAEVALRHAQLEVELAETQVWFMRNRAVPFAIVQPAANGNLKPMDKTDKDSLTGMLKRMYQGARNAGRTLVQSGRWEWIQLQGKWNEMAFQEQFDQAYEAVATAFDMPVSLLRSNFSNFAEAETLRRDWAQSWLQPRMDWYAELYTEDLANDAGMVKQFGSGLVVVPDTSSVGIFKEDMAAKVNVINVKVAGGYMSLYEAAKQSGEKNPPHGLAGMYMWDGVPTPVSEIKELWKYKQLVAPSVYNAELITGEPLPQPVDPNAVIPEPNGGETVVSGGGNVPALNDNMPPQEAGKDAKSACVMIGLSNDADLIALQRRVKELCGDIPAEWNAPDSFHVTLMYAPSVTDAQIAALKATLDAAPWVDDMALRIGSLNSFDNLGEHALHFRIRNNPDLMELQESLYDLFTGQGIPCSTYSQPANFKPHITMGYAKQKPPPVTFHSKISVQPKDFHLAIGDEVVYRRPCEPRKSDWLPDAVYKELTDWQRIVARKGRDYMFEPRAVEAEAAAFIQSALDSDHELTAVFEAARAVLRDGLTAEAGWTQLESRSAEDYRRSIRALVRGFWSGVFAKFDFVDGMYGAIRRNFRQSWLAGAAEAGVGVDDLTEAEMNRLEDEINTEAHYVLGFADAIEENSKANGGKLAPLLERAEKWLGSFSRIHGIARTMAAADQPLIWRFDPAKENCTDCARLNGRVYRGSVWAKYNLHPKSRDLECGPGGNCGCELVPTDLPLTKGRPPKLVGPRRHVHEEAVV